MVGLHTTSALDLSIRSVPLTEASARIQDNDSFLTIKCVASPFPKGWATYLCTVLSHDCSVILSRVWVPSLHIPIAIENDGRRPHREDGMCEVFLITVPWILKKEA